VNADALRREHYNATAVDVRRQHASLLVLRVRPDAPRPAYAAGQWLQLGLGLWEPRTSGVPEETLAPAAMQELIQRSYSLSSAILAADADRLLEPEEETGYELYIGFDRARAAGRSGAALAARLFTLEPGSRLWVAERPSGSYTLADVQPGDDVLFLATGTGEAPHNRMIWELLRRRHRGRVASVVTVRRREDLAYLPVHRRLMQLFPEYRYLGVATREPESPGHRLQVMLETGKLEESAGIELEPGHCRVFLCGNAGMLGRPQTGEEGRVFPHPPGMIELLERRGFHADDPGGRLHFERYG